jgi:hypothetical protein
MYCPSCGNESTVDLNYCKRCGTNLSITAASPPSQAIVPVSLTGPSVFLALTIISGLGIIFTGANELIQRGLSPVALTWIVLFSLATLFGCSALFIHFWIKLVSLQRGSSLPAAPQRPPALERSNQPQLPPRFEPAPSVTENTTRTFAPIYREPSK